MDSPSGASNGSATGGGGHVVGVAGGGAHGSTTVPGEDGDDSPNGWNCSIHPSVFFLLGTLVLTSCSSAMLCAAIMTDHWEEVTWHRDSLRSLVQEYNNMSIQSIGQELYHIHHSHRQLIHLQWLLDGTVVRVTTSSANLLEEESSTQINHSERSPVAFLVPMHGGIWTLCVNLSEEEITLLGRVGFPPVKTCVNYLAGGIDGAREEPRSDWQHRMQNLSISCALVCLIVLGSAALVGAFGVCRHQISAVLVTGVMYLLAASFALFTLTIIHFKRKKGGTQIGTINPTGAHADGTVDGVVTALATIRGGSPAAEALRYLLSAREFSTAWSLDLGWGGVMLTVMTSVLWILLSKIMRFNPISSMIN
ncbi:uncharacterized protein LOC123295122 isoform X2 [Chrysoperla carnea]|uniref:uncharacterized protein LOC123295122 isoform X2 n=1 Tax=Chrysoperla carnea TaxID=189513 RepID=UPI001D0964C8|nr:uncharacterized protein LOC123295122 isoform X2 [Chrysoperla carnea]